MEAEQGQQGGANAICSPSAGTTVQPSTDGDPEAHLQPREGGVFSVGISLAEHKGDVCLPLHCLPGSQGSADLNSVFPHGK